MDTAYRSAAADLNRSALCRDIREYSLFQGIGQVLLQLHRLVPVLSEEQLYERLEFHANPSLAFPGSDIERLEFIEDTDGLRARLQLNLGALMGSGSPLRPSTANRHSATACRAAPRVTSSTSSTTDCIGCCCRYGASTAITPASARRAR